MSSVHSYPIFGNWRDTLMNWRAILGSLRLSSHVRDVSISSRVNNDTLMYNSRLRRWENKSLYNVLTNAGEFHEDIALTAGSEVGTVHNLGVAPKMVLITKRVGGLVEDGPTAHTPTAFYLKNRGTTAATVSVLLIP